MIVLGLDISSRSTGWAVIKNNRFYKRVDIDYGFIKPPVKMVLAEKLKYFSEELSLVVDNVCPDKIAIEDIFLLRNVSTLKLLGRFSGVAIRTVYSASGVIPEIVPVTEARASVLGTQDKKEVFNLIKKKYKLEGWDFDKMNDITDAITVALYVSKFME